MENIPTRVGAAIKRLRHLRGLTQQQLEDKSGTSAVAMIESGRRRSPQHATLEKIADALGVEVVDLTGRRRPARRVRR